MCPLLPRPLPDVPAVLRSTPEPQTPTRLSSDPPSIVSCPLMLSSLRSLSFTTRNGVLRTLIMSIVYSLCFASLVSTLLGFSAFAFRSLREMVFVRRDVSLLRSFDISPHKGGEKKERKRVKRKKERKNRKEKSAVLMITGRFQRSEILRSMTPFCK